MKYWRCLILLMLASAVVARAERVERLSSLELADGVRLDLLVVSKPIPSPVEGFDEVRFTEIRLTEPSASAYKVVYNPGGFLEKSSTPMKSKLRLFHLYDAKVSQSSAEILALGMAAETIELLRFDVSGVDWKFVGAVEIFGGNANKDPCREATLSGQGQVSIVRELSGKQETYEISVDGVVRSEGQIFLPERVAWVDNANPADAYREKFRASRYWYHRRRDEVGIPIDEPLATRVSDWQTQVKSPEPLPKPLPQMVLEEPPESASGSGSVKAGLVIALAVAVGVLMWGFFQWARSR